VRKVEKTARRMKGGGEEKGGEKGSGEHGAGK